MGNPLKFSSSKTKYKHIGGLPGKNTQEILLEVGLKQEEIDSLRTEIFNKRRENNLYNTSSTADENTQYHEWDLDYGQQDIT